MLLIINRCLQRMAQRIVSSSRLLDVLHQHIYSQPKLEDFPAQVPVFPSVSTSEFKLSRSDVENKVLPYFKNIEQENKFSSRLFFQYQSDGLTIDKILQNRGRNHSKLPLRQLT